MLMNGIIPCQAIKEMIANGCIKSETDITTSQIQPASLDLRLGNFAYPIDASFLPSGMSVIDKLAILDQNFEKYKIDLTSGAVLEKGRVYLIPLMESLQLPEDIAGFANPKSSTGRLDILTRLIADGNNVFDQIDKGYKGKLYIEVAPRSFSIVVKTGARLNQIRFRIGEQQRIATNEWQGLIENGEIYASDEQVKFEDAGLLRFTVDLQAQGIIGYRAKKHTGRLDLEIYGYDINDFWEEIRFHKNSSLILDPDEFYILMTREAIAIPPRYAAEMIPYDTRAGEFRVHYAGFFDPGFGYDLSKQKAGSSRGVLEVRSHEVPFLLEHGQTVGWLRYEKLTEVPDILYGQELKSNYQGQSLKLAKQFYNI